MIYTIYLAGLIQKSMQIEPAQIGFFEAKPAIKRITIHLVVNAFIVEFIVDGNQFNYILALLADTAPTHNFMHNSISATQKFHQQTVVLVRSHSCPDHIHINGLSSNVIVLNQHVICYK